MCVWEPPRLLQGLEEAQARGTTGQQRPEERKGRARSSHSKSLEASWYPPQNCAIKVTDQPPGYSPLFDPAPPPNGCPHKMLGHRLASSLRRCGFQHLWYRFSVPSFPSIPGVDQPQPSIKHSPPGDTDLWSCSLHSYLGSRKTLVWVTDWHAPLGRNGTSRLAWVRGWGPAVGSGCGPLEPWARLVQPRPTTGRSAAPPHCPLALPLHSAAPGAGRAPGPWRGQRAKSWPW